MQLVITERLILTHEISETDNRKEKYDTLNETAASKKEEIKLCNKNTSNYRST